MNISTKTKITVIGCAIMSTAAFTLCFKKSPKPAITKNTTEVASSSPRRSAIFDDPHPNEDTFWEACEQLKNDPMFNPKDNIVLMHQIGKAYRTTSFAKEQMIKHKQRFGSKPANEATRTIILDSLKRADCPVIDMPIYQLTQCDLGSATGVTNAQGIWINEREIGGDSIELMRACTHEAGHWYYQHSLWSMTYGKNTRAQQEFDADEFSFNTLTPQLREQVLARAHQKLNPKNYMHDKHLKEILQPQTIKRDDEIIYVLTLPEREHSENIVAIARQTASISA